MLRIERRLHWHQVEFAVLIIESTDQDSTAAAGVGLVSCLLSLKVMCEEEDIFILLLLFCYL